jgi:aarF domain-containing kinase
MTVMLFGLLLRRFEVFYCATCVFTDYQIVKYRCNYPISEERREELWNQAHDRNSKFLCDRFVRLEGLWVKLGQYLSSRADVMPEAYLKSLSKCQDSLPPRPFAQVRELVEAEFKAPIESIFSSVDEVPIACASIAQVHRGQLKDGRQVVLKIQHADVAECMRQDLLNLQTLGDVFKAFDPDFDFSPVIREWASEVPKGEALLRI